MKKCVKCNLLIDFKFFNKWSYSKDGYSSYCKSCRSIIRKEERNSRTLDQIIKENKQKIEYYLKNKDRHKKISRKNYLKNRMSRIESSKFYILNNPDNRKKYIKTYHIKRSKFIINSTPNWYNINEIKLLKIFAKKCGITTDHIIPLINKNVCGLNVDWNLQFLTKEENSIKNNSFDFTNDNNSWREYAYKTE